MNDFLVELGARPSARRMIQSLGLPIPLPQRLRREANPWRERPLEDRTAVVHAAPGAELSSAIAEALASAGAATWVDADDALTSVYKTAGEGWGRPVDCIDASTDLRPDILVLDASGIVDPDGLRALYDFFHPRLRSLRRCGRVVVLGRPADTCDSVPRATAQRALEGFVRSLSKEIGGKGATAQTLYVEPGAESRIGPVLRFFLSDRSAYVTAQPLRLSAAVTPPDHLPMTRPLDGKVALVTGAARGIGAATARALAREGAHVIVLDRPDDDGPASGVAEEVNGSLLLCDITDADAAERLTALIGDEHGGIDIIVHNAGVTRDKTLKNMDEARWDLTIDVNLKAVLQLTKALEPLFRPDARIICLSSIAGIAGNFGQTNYSASKAGVIGFVQAASVGLAERGIAVNAIAPGFIETRLTAAIPAATREVARRLSNLSQGGLPEDIAEVVTFLSSPGAAALSGQILRVCGGSYVGA